MITNIILVTCIIAVLVAIYKQWQLENAKKDNAYYVTLLESEKQQTRSHLVNLQLEMEQTTRLRDELAKERQSGKIWREKADVQNTWSDEVARLKAEGKHLHAENVKLREEIASLAHDNTELVKRCEELSNRVEKTKEIRRASAARVRARKKGNQN
jgi:predicted  nucleic acid-binding Zn-ribbon protein